MVEAVFHNDLNWGGSCSKAQCHTVSLNTEGGISHSDAANALSGNNYVSSVFRNQILHKKGIVSSFL